MPTVYRVMKLDDNKPKIAMEGSCLSVRVPPDPTPDLVPEADGRVKSGTGGMSVNSSMSTIALSRMPSHYIKEFPGARGSKSQRVFKMGDGLFVSGVMTEKLVLRVDPDDNTHGFAEPALEMPIEDFQQALADTRDQWVMQ